jgi:hypothetical protein
MLFGDRVMTHDLIPVGKSRPVSEESAMLELLDLAQDVGVDFF